MTANLIDSYVAEVGRRLPAKNRADIEAEIRSTLQDMVDERSRIDGKPADEDMIVEVLKAFGAPEKVAGTYTGERYLIGPRIYPIFMLVLRIVLIVTGILAAIGFGIAMSQTVLNPQQAFETFFKALANFGNTIVIALGNIVLIFAIIEWALYRAGEKVDVKGLKIDKDWDPRALLKVSTPQQVKIGETIVEVVGCFASIIIFNFYPQIIGFTPSLNSVIESGSWSALKFIPLLSEAFFRFVPYLTFVWVSTIVLNIVLLRMSHWTIPTRVIAVGLKLISIIIAAAMLAGPSLIALTFESLSSAMGNPEGAQVLMTLITQAVKVALWLTIIGTGIDIIRMISRSIASRE